MFRVVAVSDKVDTAIDRLCKGVEPYHNGVEYFVCDVHPKRPDQRQLQRFEDLARTADVIDYQYYRTADMLRERYAWLKEKPSILTHNNPYAIHERDWNDYNIVVANNQTMKKDLENITTAQLEYIPLVQDIHFFKFKRTFEPNNTVIMVANRIESKKGILEVALACQELGLKMILVGAISNRDYFLTVMATNVVEFHEQISDEALRDLYYKSTLHVCNSTDNFESGTLPILEAMFCGVPVLSREVGHVPDIYNGENMFINKSHNEDVEHLTEKIHSIFADKKKLEEVRQKAWDSVKGLNFERRAYSYRKLYDQLRSIETPVSVIVPISGKQNITTKCLNAIAEQDYPNVELIVVDDGESQEEIVKDFARTTSIPVQYHQTQGEGYNLAQARNIGIINSHGEILVFCDQRMIMEKSAVSYFVANLSPRQWVFGDKDGKKNFVENFSAIFKEDIVYLGMFNERVNKYGGMSQEIRSRANKAGIRTRLIKEAKAKPEGSSKNKHEKRDDIVKMKNMLWKLRL